MTSLKRRSIRKEEESSTPSTENFLHSPRRTPRKQSLGSSTEDSDDLSGEDAVDCSHQNATSPRVYPCLKEVKKQDAKLKNPLQKSSPKPDSKQFPSSQPELQSKSNASFISYTLNCLFVVFIVVLLVVFVKFLIPGRSSTFQTSSTTWDEPLISVAVNYTMLREDMTYSLKKLRKEFPSSEVHLWKSAWACLNGILMDTPSQPGVILLAPETEQALPTSQCVAGKLAQLTSHLLQRITGVEVNHEWTINAAAFQGSTDAANFMEDVKHRLSRGLVLIQNVDLLPSKLAVTLHGLCDNENAPYKQSVVILLLSQPPPMGNSGLQDSIDRYLIKVWTRSGELKIDSVSSLVSRTSNYAASVGAEPRQTCEV